MEVDPTGDARAFVIAAVTLVGMDLLWFSLVAPRLGAYAGVTFRRPAFGVLAWGALAYAVSCLRTADGAAAWGGAWVGAVTYLVFNGTYLALHDSYPVGDAVVDVLWGTCVCALASAVANDHHHTAPRPARVSVRPPSPPRTPASWLGASWRAPLGR